MTTENNETIPQMRERIDSLTKQVKGLETDKTSLQGQLKARDARDAFAGQGFKAKLGDLYVSQNPEGDLSPEAVTEWATELGFSVESTDTSGTEDTSGTAGNADLALLAGGGSGAGAGGAEGADRSPLTIDEWKTLQRTDPVAAKAALSRVQVSPDNPWLVKPTASQGNPFVPNVKE